MKLLALDLSSHTGFAVGEHDAIPRFGTWHLAKTGEDVGRFIGNYDDQLNAAIDLEHPDRLVFEAPLMLGGGDTNLTTTRKLMGLASHTEFVCHVRGIVCREANVSTVKKFWAGTGRAKKPDMIAAARRWGHDVKDDNQADALGVWSYQVHAIYPDQRHRWSAGQLGAAA